ncbi:MAG: hypothetical protein ACI910_000620 [Oleispira sp.]|jgi:hypothetical protein
MLKVVIISIVGFSLVACGGSSSNDGGSSSENLASLPKNKDIEPNSNFNQSQQLYKTAQTNQANLNEDVTVINLEGSLDSINDKADFFATGVVDRSGDYIVAAGWSSELEKPINSFQLDIYNGNSIFKTINSNGGEQSTAFWCLEVNTGDDLTFSINTEDDYGSYSFNFIFFSNLGESCDQYNGNEEPNNDTEYTYVYKMNSLGAGVCSQEGFSGTELPAGMVSNLDYSYGKCEDLLGTDAFAYCEVSSLAASESRYYFENTMTTDEAQLKCLGWGGSYSNVGS